MQYWPPGTMVSAQRGAEPHRFDSSDAAHSRLHKNPYASVLVGLVNDSQFFDGALHLGSINGLLRTKQNHVGPKC